MIKKNSLRFSVLGVLTLLTLLSFASAAITVNPTSVTFNKFTLVKTFTITTDVDNTILNSLSSSTISDNQAPANTVTVSFSAPVIIGTPTGTPSANLDVGETATITATSTLPNNDFTLGTFSTTKNITTGVPSVSGVLTLNFGNTPNEKADNGNLNIDDVDVFVENGFGDDTEWYPLDKIRVTVDVSNDANDEIRNIVVEWGLYDKKNTRWVIQDEESDFDLDEDDENTVEFTFLLDKMNKLETDGDYIFYVWATGDDKETDNETSTFSSLAIDLTIDSHLVVLNSLEIVGTASCGETVQISGEVWNIGDDDEQDVYLKVFNTALGISQRVEIGDIDSFESKDLLFNVIIPEDVEEGNYDLSFLVYDDSDDIFESSDGDKSEFILPVSIVSGSCSTEVPVTIFANLESAAKAGEEFSVRATITNTASTRKTFTLELSDYASWSALVSVDKPSFTLDAGSAGDVLIKLRVNEGVSGDKNFNIVMKEGTKVLTQPVSVSIPKQGVSLTGWISGLGLGGNTYLWAIGALNILLVFIIIIVAVRVVRKK